jgi:hypothetical protein
MSLAGLSGAVHFTKGYLSKVENGKARVTRDLAKACDRALDARGELYKVAYEDARVGVPDQPLAARADDEPVVQASAPVAIGAAALDELGQLLWHYRVLTRSASPRLAVAAAHAHATHLQQQRDRGDGEVTVLAARAAEYVGWVEQELGNTRAARDWTAKAADLARVGGSLGFEAYSRLRMADLALESGEDETALAHVRAAEVLASKPWLQGLAALRRARVHALRGESRECEAVLSGGVQLFSRQAPLSGFGEDSILSNAALKAVHGGWALYDLGRLKHAESALVTALVEIPQDNLRLRYRVRARLALVRVKGGDVGYACEQAEVLAADARLLESAPTVQDLRELRRAMGRWHGPWAQQARGTLTEVLREHSAEQDRPGELHGGRP